MNLPIWTGSRNPNLIFSLTEGVMVDNLTYQDAQEGIRAFFEKRPPVWQEDNGSNERK